MVNQEGLKLIQERRSIRAFEDRQISEEELQELVKVAVNSPSAHNKQLFLFTVVQDKQLLDDMAEAIREVMLAGTPEQQEKAKKPGYSPLYYAPTVIMISGELKSGFNVQSDCGIAAGLLMAAAEQMGLASCMIGSSVFMFRGEKGEELKARLGIPENYQSIGGIALGYMANEKPAPTQRREGLVNIIR